MKALGESRTALADRAGLILLFDGEVDPAVAGPDERNPTGILTPDLTSLPPSRSGDQWLWEFVARYSGATVPGFHGVP
jgi:hypothetical protein